jgi:hypothetical protein
MKRINYGAFLLVLALCVAWWFAQSPRRSGSEINPTTLRDIEKDLENSVSINYSKFIDHRLQFPESFEYKMILQKSYELEKNLGGFHETNYVDMARQGKEDIMLDLCRRYSYGRGVPKDYEKAYKTATDVDFVSWKSQLVQAFHLLKGLGVEADIDRAEKIYWVILDKPGITEKAHLWLVNLLYSKSKVDISRKADFLRVLESGCSKGFADCLRFRAAISLNSAQTSEEKIFAKNEYERASATGDRDVAFEFASLRLEGIFGDAAVKDGYLAMKELAHEGCEVAMRRVGLHLIKVGDIHSVDWLDKARLSGDAMAEECLKLARKSIGVRK